ncbi:DUF6289 family protein [Nonomuraea jiangxiensis]|uniref:Peptidase inhibitor family I36 n=1 Tax=Nonomuraea jiangxiensis TaxID=633440 RepID=A0A1G8Q579_9ACTN|nr:DUF6289 family protein [Nonomuraea jiangxiensis]SDI99877.1 hypothetical protein SAMN05421869_108132 [Nonomuraea jiangxiensis]
MIRRALLATFFGIATIAVTAAPAQARPCFPDHYCVTTYYSDSAYTSVVGQKYEGCAGDAQSWGVRSIYPEFTEIPC